MATNQAKLSTRQHLVKIPNISCLYRHGQNETYYAIKKIRGKRKEHSLGTTDRKIADRRLKEWLADLEKIDTEVEKMPLSVLLEKFEAINQGKADKTRRTNASIVKRFKETWKRGLSIHVRDVKPSDLSEWLASHEERLANCSYNRYAFFLKQLFAIAVADRVIVNSPLLGVQKRWKKPQKPIRYIPTVEQFQQLVQEIRRQVFNSDAEHTADFVEFLGTAGLGQAEASDLTWEAVDWERGRMAIRRRKTSAVFYVPIFDPLRPLLERLWKSYPTAPAPSEKVFKIKDAKRALKAACIRLGFRNYSQRNLRAGFIRRAWEATVDPKTIAQWQGHQDGGKLIINTYTEVFGGQDSEYERKQLAKMASTSKPQTPPSHNGESESSSVPLNSTTAPS